MLAVSPLRRFGALPYVLQYVQKVDQNLVSSPRGHSYQCVVRNAKLSHCETVRNVSHGLRRRPQAGETCETSFAQAVRAKAVVGSSPAYRNSSGHV